MQIKVLSVITILFQHAFHAAAFVPQLHEQRLTTLQALSRRAWFDVSISFAGAAFAGGSAAFAEDAVDDLAMPSEEEEKAAAAAAMEAKLRKKAELQKATGKPMGFKENFEAEKKKQEQLKKTKEERRIALCEELGRGC